MAGYFVDSRAIAKAYRQEAGTATVATILADASGKFVISSLTAVEFQSVFAQKVRAGLLAPAEFQLVRRKFGGDVRARRILVKGLLRRHQRAAERLIATHGPLRRLRTLDALQLAVAAELWQNGTVAHFVVADQHLADVARLEGIAIINPEAP
ncbi:MAG TPA: type II toxin-antitoxin system VapC family toxin [Pirellulales bacterium]|jgi:predicted nucleic acid-binding protein|nr:type II toxin-antitoxin system VapC family toxin [Pirellulales bacterium]